MTPVLASGVGTPSERKCAPLAPFAYAVCGRAGGVWRCLDWAAGVGSGRGGGGHLHARDAERRLDLEGAELIAHKGGEEGGDLVACAHVRVCE